MSNQILYGVGKTLLRKFTDQNEIIAMAKLKNVSIDFSANEEAVTGGDSSYAIATFPKDKAIKVSAESAVFDLSMLNATQGADVTVGAVVFSDVETVLIPSDGIINLTNTPISASLTIPNFTSMSASGTVETGKYWQDATDAKKITFATADAGKEVDIVYTWTSTATTQTIDIYQETLSKPFTFIHRIPIYDDNNDVVADGQLTIYKAKASNNFNFNLQAQTASTTKIELTAQDPRRSDGKMWSWSMSPRS